MFNILLSAYVGGYVVFLLNLREAEDLTAKNALVGLIWPLGAIQVAFELVRKLPVLVTSIKGLVVKIKDFILSLKG